MAMSITKFEVHRDGVVSISLTEMPRDAKIDNTTVYIGGTAQPEPEKSPRGSRSSSFPLAPTSKV